MIFLSGNGVYHAIPSSIAKITVNFDNDDSYISYIYIYNDALDLSVVLRCNSVNTKAAE